MTDPTPTKQHGGKRPGAGRPKQHPSSAARQEAYRQRQQQQAHAHAQALAAVASSAGLDPDQRAALTAAASFLAGKA